MALMATHASLLGVHHSKAMLPWYHFDRVMAEPTLGSKGAEHFGQHTRFQRSVCVPPSLLPRSAPLALYHHVKLQPAAELRHVQRHKHVRHVLRACPAPNLQSSPSPARCLRRGRLPPAAPRPDAHAFNQPLSFDTSSVTDMGYMFRVRSSPCPAPNLQSRPLLHAACTAVARHLPPPDPYTSPCTIPFFRLSAGRACV
eukprot:scaffold15707_cov63-Phaeocystis_antarctica.AAC.4